MTTNTDSTTTSRRSTAGTKAIELVFVLAGVMPRSDSRIEIRTPPSTLTRSALRKARRGLADALEGMEQFYLAERTLRVETADGVVLRSTRLIEGPDGELLVAERGPGEGAGSLDDWMVRVVVTFGRTRSTDAALARRDDAPGASDSD